MCVCLYACACVWVCLHIFFLMVGWEDGCACCDLECSFLCVAFVWCILCICLNCLLKAKYIDSIQDFTIWILSVYIFLIFSVDNKAGNRESVHTKWKKLPSKSMYKCFNNICFSLGYTSKNTSIPVQNYIHTSVCYMVWNKSCC